MRGKMKMKFIRRIILAAMLIMNLIPAEVKAEGGTVVFADDLTAAGPGDTVTVTATASALSGVDSLAIEVKFDKNVFEVTDIVWDTDIAGSLKSGSADANNNGFFAANYGDSTSFTDLVIPDNTVFFTAKLKVKDTAPAANTTITLSSFRAYDGNAKPLSPGYTKSPESLTVEIYQKITAVNDQSITKPSKNGDPQTTISSGEHYQGTSITWYPAVTKFFGETVYTAKVTLEADTNYRFDAAATATVADAEVINPSVTENGKKFAFDAVFPATEAKIPTGLAISTSSSDTQYDDGDTFHDTLTATASYDDGTSADVSLELNMPVVAKGATSVSVGYTHQGVTVSAAPITLSKEVLSSISGTLINWDSSLQPVIRLYPDSVSEADIDADIVLDNSTKALTATPVIGDKETAAKKDTRSYAFRDMAAGTYQVGIFLPGKNLIKVLKADISANSKNEGITYLRKYGDVNDDGAADSGDGMVIYRYYAGQTTVLKNADDDLKKAADVNKDGMIDGGDGMSLYRYFAQQSSVFDRLK